MMPPQAKQHGSESCIVIFGGDLTGERTLEQGENLKTTNSREGQEESEIAEKAIA